MIYVVDLDGTLCTNTFGDYIRAQPISKAIERVNDLYRAGNIIKIYTARGTGSGLDLTELTLSQLNDWGVSFTELILGKPEGDIYIDDRGLSAADWLRESSKQRISPVDYIYSSLQEAATVMIKGTSFSDKILEACEMVFSALEAGRKILWCGNGGSAADSQHLAAELVGRFGKNRSALSSIALTTDSSVITAIGNDFGFENIFARQVEAIGVPGDVLVAISTSGESENVIRAASKAQESGIQVISFTGEHESSLDHLSTLALKAPSKITSHIQEIHITWGQIICGFAEMRLFPQK